MWSGTLAATSTASYSNYPLPPAPPVPDPRDSQTVDRHLGMFCMCPLLDCCHNEGMPSCGACGHHVDSGSPHSGHLWPWSEEQCDAEQRYWSRPDPDEHPEGSLERLVIEAELEEWRKREQLLRLTGAALMVKAEAIDSQTPCAGKNTGVSCVPFTTRDTLKERNTAGIMATPDFHITLYCEGRTEIARSPRDGGGFSAVIYMKHEGEMLPALTITGRQEEGRLSLTVTTDLPPHLLTTKSHELGIQFTGA